MPPTGEFESWMILNPPPIRAHLNRGFSHVHVPLIPSHAGAFDYSFYDIVLLLRAREHERFEERLNYF